MRLTQHTDFSVRVLIHLALRPDRLTTISEVSEAYNISRNHLMKVVQKLAKAGFIESIRGQGGGLRLSREPGEIPLGDVVEAMEPDFGMVECMRPRNQCAITTACRLPPILSESLRLFLGNLNRYTLADLVPADARAELITLLDIEKAS